MREDPASLKQQIESLQEENLRLRQELSEAQSANLAKEAFLSSMSHDIRTPMNAIVGMTVLAKNHIDEKRRVADALNKIETASAHLLSLINDVLDMARINSGRMQIAEELFSLSDLLYDTLTIVRPQAEQRKHSFRFEAHSILEESLYGDALRLRQIFVNIINNAVKYTPQGGEIRVFVAEEMAQDRCNLVFRCQDNGIGMTEEFLQRIFDPFERVSSATISGVEGTGLGMSIVKKLIEAMEGSIQIQSAPGAGTSVTVTVPLRFAGDQVHAKELEGKQILIVEADAELQTLYRQYLEDAKITCTLVSSASEAISAITEAEFNSTPFACAILGRSLGAGAELFEFAAHLHQADREMVLVLVSDADWPAIEYHANRSGIHAFIPVPFFRKSLLNGLALAMQSSAHETGSLGVPDLTGKRLLLAEDNFINREIACEILAQTNVQVDCAENGQEAVDLFHNSAPGTYTLILMDIQMPVLDGYSATRAIRSGTHPDGKRIPIWAMTANAFAEDIAKAEEAGMNGHLAKPIDIEQLMQTLRGLL